MTEEQIALARRAVACKKWRWMLGMRTRVGWRVYAIRTDNEPICMMDDDLSVAPGPLRLGPSLPDLTDAATLGCLLALVREAHGDPVLFARFRGARVRPDWVVSWDSSDVIATGATEAEALVAALEAAPEEKP